MAGVWCHSCRCERRSYSYRRTIATADINGGAIDGTTIGGLPPPQARLLRFLKRFDDNADAVAITIDLVKT